MYYFYHNLTPDFCACRGQTMSSRLKNARSRVPRLIIEGMDLDEVTDRMVKVSEKLAYTCSSAAPNVYFFLDIIVVVSGYSCSGRPRSCWSRC